MKPSITVLFSNEIVDGNVLHSLYSSEILDQNVFESLYSSDVLDKFAVNDVHRLSHELG